VRRNAPAVESAPLGDPRVPRGGVARAGLAGAVGPAVASVRAAAGVRRVLAGVLGQPAGDALPEETVVAAVVDGRVVAPRAGGGTVGARRVARAAARRSARSAHHAVADLRRRAGREARDRHDRARGAARGAHARVPRKARRAAAAPVEGNRARRRLRARRRQPHDRVADPAAARALLLLLLRVAVPRHHPLVRIVRTGQPPPPRVHDRAPHGPRGRS